MPNCMNFDVWGPVSVRRNDNYSLNHSRIEDKMRALQAGQPLLSKILFGDSVYRDNDLIVTGTSRWIAAIRYRSSGITRTWRNVEVIRLHACAFLEETAACQDYLYLCACSFVMLMSRWTAIRPRTTSFVNHQHLSCGSAKDKGERKFLLYF